MRLNGKSCRKTDLGDSRAMTNDGAFRVIAARTTDTVQSESSTAQSLSGPVAQDLADLVDRRRPLPGDDGPFAPCAMYHSALPNESRPARRGLAPRRAGAAAWFKRATPVARRPTSALTRATLEMMRTLPNSELHRGIVEVPEHRESFRSVHALHAVIGASRIDDFAGLGHSTAIPQRAAGGFVVQLLPEAKPRPRRPMAIDDRALGGLRRHTPAFAGHRQFASPRLLIEADLRRYAVHLAAPQRPPVRVPLQPRCG